MATKKKIKHSFGENIFDILNILFLILLCGATVYPMIHVAFASISNSNLLLQHQGLLLRPMQPTMLAYQLVFENPNVLSGFKNSFIIILISIPLNVLMTSLGAYFLSRKNVLYKKPITFIIVFTMWFGGGMVPFFLTVYNLNLLNTLASVIIPFMVSTYNLIIMRTSFAALPDSLEESAKLDGAGHFTILFKIVLPLSKAVVAVMILYYGVDKWNGWFWASTFISERSLHPIQVVLRGILIQNDTSLMMTDMGGDTTGVRESVKYATTMVATIPVLLIYPFIQKYFVKGVMIGAIKG